ncbi:unnamed protein product, partial [marine sediment metagenome]
DGSEEAELHESNVFDMAKLRLAKAQAGDGYQQARTANALLVKCRDMLELVMCDDKQLQRDCQELVFEIEEYYPKGG